MTDSATAVAAPAGTSADATATAATSGSTAATATDLWAGLQNAESRTWVESKGFKALDPLVESARHADKLQSEITDLKGKALTPPDKDAKPEVWNEFWSKIGRPDKPDGYDYPLPEGLPENLPWDGELDTVSKQWFFDEGATAKQAAALRGKLAQYQASQFVKMQEAEAAQVTAADAEIVKEFGAHGTDGHKAFVQHADRAINNLGIMDELKAGGYLTQKGEVRLPKLAKALALVGRQLYSEDTLVTGSKVAERADPAKTLYPTDPFYPNGR